MVAHPTKKIMICQHRKSAVASSALKKLDARRAGDEVCPGPPIPPK